MRNHRGAALLAAMLTVTLVATLAATALWQQWRSELIIRCIDDYRDGKHFGLELIRPSL